MKSSRSDVAVGRLDGTYDFGACGLVPLIRCDFPMPKLTNNGWACYIGMPPLSVPGLYDALPDDPERRPLRQGHVMVVFSDGERFGTYASLYRPEDSVLLS